MTPGTAATPAAERFWPKVNLAHPSGCWLWLAGTRAGGYGRFRIGSQQDGTRRVVQAHRWAYENLVGPVLPGMVLDHLCSTPACVNPWHLEPVTTGENVRRGLRGRRQTPEHVARRTRSRLSPARVLAPT